MTGIGRRASIRRVEELSARLAALDPASILVLARPLPAWAGGLVAAIGVALAVAGGHKHVFRFVASALGGAVGFGLGHLLAPLAGVEARLGSFLGAGALSILGGVSPPAMCFVAFGAVGGLAGAKGAPAGDVVFGIIPGVVLVGGLAVALFASIARITSALVGGALVAVGGAAVALGTSLAATIEAYPWLAWLGGGLVAIAGAAFQLTRPPPEELEKAKAEKREDDKKKKELAEQEKRWEKYTKATSSNEP